MRRGAPYVPPGILTPVLHTKDAVNAHSNASHEKTDQQLKGDRKLMKKLGLIVLALTVAGVAALPALAGDNPLQKAVKGCQKELETYCKDVTPGKGRGLACLYAHGDKLSGQCEYALYDAAAQLQRAVAALSYVANECKEDLMAQCKGVPAGKGRLLNCLRENDAKVSQRCKQARKDVGLK